jgi:hypothetical protein
VRVWADGAKQPQQTPLAAASCHEKGSAAPQLTKNMLVDPRNHDKIVKKAAMVVDQSSSGESRSKRDGFNGEAIGAHFIFKEKNKTI